MLPISVVSCFSKTLLSSLSASTHHQPQALEYAVVTTQELKHSHLMIKRHHNDTIPYYEATRIGVYSNNIIVHHQSLE